MAQEQTKATPDVQALLDQAKKALSAKQLAEAGMLYEKALAKARELKDRKGEANTLFGMGIVYLNAGQAQKALEVYQQALPLQREIGDKRAEAATLVNIGLIYRNLSQPQKAQETLNQALTLARASGDRVREAVALTNLGLVYRNLGQPQKAQEALSQALPLHRENGDKSAEAATLTNLGLVYRNLSQPQKALEAFSQALPLHRATGNKQFEANTLTNLGVVYRNLGQPQKAQEALSQALPLHRATGGKSAEADTFYSLGLVYFDLDQLQQALEVYNQALTIYKETGDKEGEAGALNNLGLVYRDLGQPQKALEVYQQALPLHRKAGDKSEEAGVLSNLGTVYANIGQPQAALEVLNQALTIARETGDKRGEADMLSNLGIIYRDLGQPQKALEVLSPALTIYRQTGNKKREAGALTTLGIVYANTGQPERELEFYNQALTIYKEIGDKGAEAGALTNLGIIYANTGQSQKALEALNQTLPLHRATGNKQFEANTLLGIGRAYLSAGQPQKALEFYNQALTIYKEIGDKRGEANTLDYLAMVELRLQQPALAEVHLAQAVALYETIRENLGGLSEAKSTFLGSTIKTYYTSLNLLLERGKTTAAFEMAQKTKARSLLDLMASGRVKLDGELTVEERAQEQELRQRADFLNAQMVKEGVQNEVGAKKRFAALKEELLKTESQLQTLTDTLYARHPGLAQKRVAKTATLTDIAKLLPADTALLDYIVLGKNKLALFVVTRSDVQALTLPLAYPSLASKATLFRAACGDPRKDVKPAAGELYKLLLAPAAKHLTGAKRLVICPDGALWDIPFQALLAGGQFLAQRYEISYAYSATGAQAALSTKANRKKPTQTLLAVANPDFGSSERFGDLDNLPGQRPIDTPSRPIDTPSRPIDTPSRPIDTPSRPIDTPSRPIDTPSRAFASVSRGKAIVALPGTQREADALKKLFPGTVLMTGKAAQEGNAKAEAGKFRYLHFATHGFFNDTSPLLSSLVLAAPVSPGLVSPGSCLATPNDGGKPCSCLATPPPNPPSLGVAVSAAGGNGSAAGGKTEDGFLTAREIFDLDLSAEMVVLSACNTARGVQRTGDGVIGLTWALFVAGCTTQVVSQWSVDDASTATLMTGFYGNLAKGKLGKGAALRQASLALMGDPKHAHPYYWAPFILMGDWR